MTPRTRPSRPATAGGSSGPWPWGSKRAWRAAGLWLGVGLIFWAAVAGRPARAERRGSLEDVLRRVYPNAETLAPWSDAGDRPGKEEGAPSRPYILHRGREIMGYAFVDEVWGYWGPIRFVVCLDPGGVVLDVVVLELREARGRPIAGHRFLRQYRGRRPGEPLRLGREIHGVTGATVSSRAVTDGVRRVLDRFARMRPTREDATVSGFSRSED